MKTTSNSDRCLLRPRRPRILCLFHSCPELLFIVDTNKINNRWSTADRVFIGALPEFEVDNNYFCIPKIIVRTKNWQTELFLHQPSQLFHRTNLLYCTYGTVVILVHAVIFEFSLSRACFSCILKSSSTDDDNNNIITICCPTQYMMSTSILFEL